MSASPNILWLMSDQHAAHALRCYGNPDVHTPHLDALAADGIRFDRAYCNNPICGPSRACFITGLYVHTHGITGNNIQDYTRSMPLNVAEHFRNNGYHTAMIGKGHLPKAWLDRGFEHLRLVDMADADPDDPLSVHYFAHLVEHGLADTFDLGTLYPPHPGAGMAGFISDTPFAHSSERWTGDESLRFLQEHRDPERPFFLKVSFQRPHDPYSPSPEQAGLYDPSSLTLPKSAEEFFEKHFEGKPAYQRDYAGQEPGCGYPYRPRDPDDLRRQLAYYYTLVSVIDAEIGRLVDYLKANGEYENTIIVYHADHGDFAGQHGLMLKNLGTYESIHRIPWLMRYPGCPRGKVCDGMVESVDLYPSLCQLAGLNTPEQLDGVSLVAVVNDASPGKTQVCTEWDFPTQVMRTVLSIRTREQRLVFYPDRPDDGELYDHRADPGEMHNRYCKPDCATDRLALTQGLLQHVSHFHRNVDFATQSRPTGPSAQIHKQGKRWSNLSQSVAKMAEK